MRESLETPDGKRRYVRQLFATIADRYDLITVLLSYGQDRRWKNRLLALASPRRGELSLDLACGTGDLTFGAASCGARAVGLDITPRMIELARSKPRRADTGFLVGDMMALPFPDASFDLITTGYGLRNVPRIEDAIREMHRVLKPSGRLLSLDFNRPANAVLRATYLAYLTLVGATLGLVLHGDPDTYRYIPASIRRYPGAEGVVRLMAGEGFEETRSIPLLGGLMAIHVARKAAD
jgi:ubiquinone/menaquinone biosynthesis methyltransferase